MNKNIGALILLAIILFVGYVVPITMTLGNQEISNPEITFQINLFSGLLFAGVIGTAVLYYARYLMKKDDAYGNSFGFFDIGDSPSIKFFKRFSALQLTLLFAIFFGIMFLSVNYLSFQGNFTGFSSAKVLPQQFTPTQSLLFSTFLIPSSEEIIAMFVTGMLVLGLILLALKYKIRKTDFLIYYYLLIPIIMGIIAIIWHSSAYPGSDIGKQVVFVFWSVKTLLNLLIGFFVIGWLLHTFNNFFIDFTRLYTSDKTFWVVLAIIVVMIAVYILIYKKNIFGTNNQQKSEDILR